MIIERPTVSFRRHGRDRCAVVCRGALDAPAYQKLLESVEICLRDEPDYITIDCSEAVVTRGFEELLGELVGRCLGMGVAVDLCPSRVNIRLAEAEPTRVSA